MYEVDLMECHVELQCRVHFDRLLFVRQIQFCYHAPIVHSADIVVPTDIHHKHEVKHVGFSDEHLTFRSIDAVR